MVNGCRYFACLVVVILGFDERQELLNDLHVGDVSVGHRSFSCGNRDTDE